MPEEQTPNYKPEVEVHWMNRPYWQFWGVVVTLLLFAIGYWVNRIQEEFSALSYTVLSSGPLVDVKDTVGGRLKLSFDSQPVKNLNFSLIKIQNDGTKPLRAVDFEGPLTVNLGSNVRIYTAQIAQRQPFTLQAKLLPSDKTQKTSNLQIKTGLLNPNDSIVVKLVSSDLPKITVSGRIVGVKEITKREISEKAINDQDKFSWGSFLISLAPFLWLWLWITSQRELKACQTHLKEKIDFLYSLLGLHRDKERIIRDNLFERRRKIIYDLHSTQTDTVLNTLEEFSDLRVAEETKFYEVIYAEAFRRPS